MRAEHASVVVSGPFDDIRSRDVRFFEEAAKFGPLTVLLWSDEAVEKAQGRPARFPLNERIYLLRALRYVERVVPATDVGSEDQLPQVEGVNPSAWVIAAGAVNKEKERTCVERGIQLRTVHDQVLDRFPGSPGEALISESKRKKVIVTGCYDWFHSGHVRFFEEASEHGDLYVVVGHDANIRLLKGEGRPLLPDMERRYVVGSVRFVKQALISSGNGWLDAEPEMRRIKPDIYAVNEDGDVPEKRDYCKAHGIEYLVLKRTPAPGLPKRSSTDLRGF